MNQAIELWQLLLMAVALVGGWLQSYFAIREKVIRMEENVKNMYENHSRTDDLIKDMKQTIDKIWERLEKKADKNHV